MNQLLDALDPVIAWELPDENLASALNDQARLLTGGNPEDSWECTPENTFS